MLNAMHPNLSPARRIFNSAAAAVLLLGIAAPDSGTFRVTVDEEPPVTGTFFDAYASPTFSRVEKWFYPRDLPPGLHLHYAMKANPLPSVVAHLAPLVDGLDVASAGELEVALASGTNPAAISFAGPGKTRRDHEAALAAGVTVNVESGAELRRLADLAAASGRRARVAIRVNPDFELKTSGMKMAGGPKQFGVDAELVPELLALPDKGLQRIEPGRERCVLLRRLGIGAAALDRLPRREHVQVCLVKVLRLHGRACARLEIVVRRDRAIPHQLLLPAHAVHKRCPGICGRAGRA